VVAIGPQKERRFVRGTKTFMDGRIQLFEAGDENAKHRSLWSRLSNTVS